MPSFPLRRNEAALRIVVRHVRAGVTLPEVLVALGVMGLLMALVLPAIQASREKSRQLACRNHLRQIGIALHNHQAARGYFPRGGDMREDDRPPYRRWRFHAPHVYLLPYLDHEVLFEQIDLQASDRLSNSEVRKQPVPIFRCPSDLSSIRVGNNYRANVGLSVFPRSESALTQTPKFGDGAFAPASKKLYPQHYPDGLSQTVAFSERMTGDAQNAHYSPAQDLLMVVEVAEPGDLFHSPQAPWELMAACGSLNNPAPWHLSDVGHLWFPASIHHTLYNHLLTPNHRIPDCGMDFGGFGTALLTARSLHPGGVNSLMMDGSVRFVADAIDQTIWRAIGTRNGEELHAF